MIAAANRISDVSLRRAVAALDTNRSRTIEFPELDVPGLLIDRMNPLPGDRVRISDMVQALSTGAVRIPVNGIWETAERLAKAIDTNHNGIIDDAEVRLSQGLKGALSTRNDGRVSTSDLASGFFDGRLALGGMLA